MKTLKQLTNVEKAGILHSWFPDEVPAFLETMKGICTAITENEEENRQKWQDGLFGFDFWKQLAAQAKKAIAQYGSKMPKNRRLFTDQLFDGYQAIFSVHCLTEYAKTRQLENRKFFLAVELLF
ncbi:hypothetical protein ACLI09_02555 [Flavobacterium sp. RHBU_24]|uniref:hypothetical protein n=1 Tax=Flavobacterium sp. RHBU_24 TaxID=3391185 RepID=UPI003984ADBF